MAVSGETRLAFENLPNTQANRNGLKWLGFIAQGEVDATIEIDDLEWIR